MEFDKCEGIIRYCEKNGIELWVENDKLKYKTSSVKLNEDLLSSLKKNKEELIDYFLNNKNSRHMLEIEKENRFEIFPLTDVQTAYMLGRKDVFEYGKVACHIYLEIEYEDLDIKKVEEIWEKLILTHDMLRSVIYENGTQQVLEKVPKIEIEYIDSTKEESSLKRLEMLKKEMSGKVYELGKWPMFELAVSKDEKVSILHLSMDFLIADWASIWMILTQFENMYFRGIKPELSTDLKFRDYVIAERRLKESEKYKKDAKYWIDRADSFPPAPSLPMIRNSVDNTKFKRYTLKLEPKVWSRLKKIAVTRGLTPTIAVLTAYCDVISKWSKNKDFCINLTVLNRMDLHPDVNKIVGDFTSINLLEVNDYSKEKFSDRAKILNQQLFEDLDHRLFSGVEVIRELTRKRGRDLSIMPIVFTSAIGLADVNNQMIGKLIGGITQTPQVFIDCQVMDGNFGLQINWDVREDIFPKKMIEDMFDMFDKQLNLLSNSQQCWEDVLNVELPKWQKEFRINEGYDVNNPSEELLYTKFLKNVRERPNELAVIDDDGYYTYSQLHQKAVYLAKEIVNRGVNKLDAIPILVSKGKNQVAAVLGALYMGGIYVPIDTKQPIKRIEKILKDLNAKVVLIDSSDNKLDGYNAIDVNNIINDNSNSENEFLLSVSSEEPAYIIYTSGSTGEPKGVIITHKAAMNTINDINNRYAINSNDRVLGISKLNFDLSVYDIFGMLSAGGAIVYFSEKDYMNPSIWFNSIINHNITVWNSVPALMKILLTHLQTLKNSQIGFPIRQVLLSGDWIPLDMPEEIRKLNPNIKISCLGGATEAAIWSIAHDYEGIKPDWVSIPYGKPLKNQGFRILDNNMLDCPVWVTGNIYITGEGLAQGYYNDEILTKEKFLYDAEHGQRMYKTGDIGRYLPNGEIEFLGREDNQVKIRGNRIELGEIEQTINKFDGIYASVACLSNINGDKKLVAVVEAEKNKEDKDNCTVIDHNYVKAAISSTANRLIDNLDIDEYTKILKLKSDYGLSFILKFLIKMVSFDDKNYFVLEDIENGVDINEKYKWVIKYWVQSLLEHKLLIEKEKKLYINKEVINKYETEILFKELNKIWQPKLEASETIDYIKLNGENLKGILKGETDPVGLLYYKGSDIFQRALYVDNIMAEYLNRCISNIVKNFIENSNTGRKIKILEIGAGIGATTEQIIKSIEGHDYEYYFTDVSKYFFPKAKKMFYGNEKIKFKEFDMDKNFLEQGIMQNSYDIIISSYVLENAKKIKYTLENIKRMIVPGGIMLSSLPVQEDPWLLMSQSLMMSKPEDDLRNKRLFLSSKEWLELFNESDGDTVAISDCVNAVKYFGTDLFIKQYKVNIASVGKNRLLDRLKEALPNYMVPTDILLIDSIPLNINGKLDRKKVQLLVDSYSNSNKQHIEQGQAVQDNTKYESELIKIWKEVLNISNLDRKDNFFDYGADSLVMAQVATKIRNQMDVNIPFDTILRYMLNNPTVEEVALFIEEQLNNSIDSYSKAVAIALDNSLDEEISYFKYYKSSQTNKDKMIVLIHGALGSIERYKYLGEELANQNRGEVAAIGLRDFDKYIEMDANKIIDFLADEYSKKLIETSYKAFEIIGHCFSGILAIEIAKRLVEHGIEVEQVSIIDSGILELDIDDELIFELLFIENINVTFKDLWEVESDFMEESLLKLLVSKHESIGEKTSVELFYKNNDSYKNLISELKLMDQKERFYKYAKISSKNSGNEIKPEFIEGLYKIFVQSFKALNYIPDPYFGDVNYYAVKERAGLYKKFDLLIEKWDQICIGNFDIQEINGNHFTCLENEIYAKQLADLLKMNGNK